MNPSHKWSGHIDSKVIPLNALYYTNVKIYIEKLCLNEIHVEIIDRNEVVDHVSGSLTRKSHSHTYTQTHINPHNKLIYKNTRTLP